MRRLAFERVARRVRARPRVAVALLPERGPHARPSRRHHRTVGGLLIDYAKAAPLQLATVVDADLAQVTVTDVALFPAARSRLTADALTQMRVAIEHTILRAYRTRIRTQPQQ
jgi:hypothetical protein